MGPGVFDEYASGSAAGMQAPQLVHRVRPHGVLISLDGLG